MLNKPTTDFERFFIGYDEIAKKLATISEQPARLLQNYPLFNVKKVGDNKHIIEIALAGFSKSDIEVEVVDNKLIISGNSPKDTSEYLWKGISTKSFVRHFTITDNIVINEAEFSNGILVIALETLVAEPSKRKINIKDAKLTTVKGPVTTSPATSKTSAKQS